MLLVWMVGLSLAAPFWLNPSALPHPIRGELRVAEFAEMSLNFQMGIFYPRWASHFNFGYGSPVFNYTPPLARFVGGGHMLLTQSNPATSLALVSIASLLLMGSGLLLFVRARWGSAAGVIASLLYMSTPVLFFRLAYFEVALEPLLSAALIPYVLWSLDQALTRQTPRDLALASLCGGLLLLAGGALGGLLLIFALGWGGALTWAYPSLAEGRWRLAVVAALAGGLSAIYWLPAWLESNAARTLPLLLSPSTFNLRDVFLPPPLLDPQIFNPTAGFAIGVATWGLALGGIGVTFSQWRLDRPSFITTLPFTLGLFLCLVLIGFWSDGLADFWASWRLYQTDFLLPLALFCAFLGGQVAYIFEWSQPPFLLRWSGLSLLVLSIIASNAVSLRPPAFTRYEAESPLLHYLQLELQGAALGGSDQATFILPETPLPPPSSLLLNSFREGQVMKVEGFSRLSSNLFSILGHNPVRDSFRVTSDSPQTLEIMTLNYLGWRATFNGQAVPTRTNPENGFIQVLLPAGTGVVHVIFGSTPTRTLATGLSLASLGVLIFLFSRPFKLGAVVLPFVKPTTRGIRLAALALGVLWLARPFTPTASSLDGVNRYPLIFEGGVDFIGYQASASTLKAGQTLDLRLFWAAARPNLPLYGVELRLLGADGQLYAGDPAWLTYAPGGGLTSDWRQGLLVQDRWRLTLAPRLSAGRYQVAVQVFRCETGPLPFLRPCQRAPLRAFNPQGTPLGQWVSLPYTLWVEGD
jgi:hypothetical protein